MRITLKYPDVKTFVEKFASNVSEGGIFIASRAPKAVGTRVRFELFLADGATKLLRGEGLVAWVREFDAKQPGKPHGMGLKFAKLDADSKKLVQQILTFKRERGVREDSSVSVLPVPQSTPPVDTGPIAAPPAPTPIPIPTRPRPRSRPRKPRRPTTPPPTPRPTTPPRSPKPRRSSTEPRSTSASPR
jgi:uncharacterized protein (TIGR02266 family)